MQKAETLRTSLFSAISSRIIDSRSVNPQGMHKVR
jgi:hypothetical protein